MPTFARESELEAFVRLQISERVTARNRHIYALDNKKAVDILVCRDGSDPALFFVEVKFHCAHHGRLGFGSASGRGFQPEILTKRPTYFDRHLRWVLASDTHQIGKILFLDSNNIREYVSGGTIESKFNNFQPRIWREANWLSHEQFGAELEQWLIS